MFYKKIFIIMKSNKLNREQELATLPELLKIRIGMFQQDPRFEPHEGTEVRMCMVANAIHTAHKDGLDWLDAAKVVIENNPFPERITLSSDNIMLAVDLAKAMANDEEKGILLSAPETKDLEVSDTLNVRCSASNELGIEGYMARPRSEYIQKFLKEISIKSHLYAQANA